MGIIRRYVRFMGHDAGGTLPPLTVCAGLICDGRARGEAAPGPSEVLVFVPPQWVGDWEAGRALPAGYQYVWRAPAGALLPADDLAPDGPYRPAELPPTACGPSFRRPPLRTGGRAGAGRRDVARQDE